MLLLIGLIRSTVPRNQGGARLPMVWETYHGKYVLFNTLGDMGGILDHDLKSAESDCLCECH